MGEPTKAGAVEEVKGPESDLATGIVTHDSDGESEEKDADGDGYQTASEGRDSDDESFHDDAKDDELFETEFADEGSTVQARSGDGDELIDARQEGEGEGEKQLRSAEEEQRDRQQRIDAANEAKAEGNSLFAEGKYDDALSSYERALMACTLNDSEDSIVKEMRAVLHANRAACFGYLQNSSRAVEECSKALELKPNYVKALTRRYQGREKLENYDDAIVDVKRLLELDPGNSEAQRSLRRLTPLAEEKREKLKNEMMAKLKEAGNSILGRFGMSIDNFKTVQDPTTGSYSIQFQR